ncbi:VOC family protein [Glutamicibacter sp. MCAF14]|uniref:VOC family protein n=1 Tax=Glutamicibacter sp. MCAF14 TaxID=3233043 RepID=UPI003F8DF3C0
MAQIGMITLDTVDEQSAAAWWRAVLGGKYAGQYPGFTMIRVPGFSAMLGFQKVPEVTAGKNRVHLDLSATSDRAREVEIFVKAGATRLEEHCDDPDFGWSVLRDPYGIVFCISDPHNQ